MRIVMNLILRIFLITAFLFSYLFSFDFESEISKILKDSIDFDLFDIDDFDKAHSANPDFLFMTALMDFDGEKALEKFKDLYNKNQSYKYSDYAVFEIGSYYYTKGYYLESGKWYKKIPTYYHNSDLLTESIDMFYSTLKITDNADSISYYNNIFSKLYPSFKNDEPSSKPIKIDEEIYDKQYTIQIGAFKEYSGAESRMYMLISQGFAVRIEETEINNETFYSVREGIYSTKKSANKIILRIKARTGLECMIIEL